MLRITCSAKRAFTSCSSAPTMLKSCASWLDGWKLPAHTLHKIPNAKNLSQHDNAPAVNSAPLEQSLLQDLSVLLWRLRAWEQQLRMRTLRSCGCKALNRQWFGLSSKYFLRLVGGIRQGEFPDECFWFVQTCQKLT